MVNKLIVFLLILISSTPLMAETVWEYVDQKLEKKEFERWTLASWLYTKEKIQLQDQWLSMNLGDDSIFIEAYVDAAKTSFDVDTANNLNETTDGGSTEAGFYLGFLGVTYRYEKYDTHYRQSEGAMNLRIIGSSHQSTHLILTYGQRRLLGVDEREKFSQSFYGGDISLYLTSFLGFDGRYRIYSKVYSDDETYELESRRSQWGAFIDISFVRIFAYQFEENFDFKINATNSEEERQTKGTAVGMRLYF